MAKSKQPAEQRKNGFDDDDLRQVLTELDEMDDEIETIMASARGKVSAIKKRQQNRIKIADKELKIPPAIVRALRKQRKLERQMEAIAADVPEDLIEVYEDAAGQFSLFGPADGVTPAQAAAKGAKATVEAQHQAEQEAGAKVLDELAGGYH